MIDKKSNFSWTPLQLAVRENHVKAMSVLLEHDASLYERNHVGETALHIAVDKNQMTIFEPLVAAGVDLDAPDLCS